jgi:hypothetical protein
VVDDCCGIGPELELLSSKEQLRGSLPMKIKAQGRSTLSAKSSMMQCVDV